MVREVRFELTTSCSQSKRATGLRYTLTGPTFYLKLTSRARPTMHTAPDSIDQGLGRPHHTYLRLITVVIVASVRGKRRRVGYKYWLTAIRVHQAGATL